MKHIFYVHSHITFYCSLNAIKYLSLISEDCIFLCARNYKNPNYPTNRMLDISELHDRYSTQLTKSESSQALKEVDQLIQSETNGECFHYYTSTLSHLLKEIIANHPKCKAVEIIEEGISSYMKAPEYYQKRLYKYSWYHESWLEYIKPLFGTRRRVRGNGAFNTEAFSNQYYFGFHEGVFPYIDQNKIILNSQFPNEELKEFVNLSKENLFVFDAVLVEQKHLLTIDEFVTRLMRLIISIHHDEKKFYLKFHPSQTSDTRKKIKDMLVEIDYDIVEIPDHIPTEQLLRQADDVNVFGIFSTLLFYAKKMGHRVTSFYSTFFDFPPIKEMMSKYPGDFPTFKS